MTKQTIVHVGPHKTGSTALQVAFFEGRKALARAGVHYAHTGRRGHAHFDLIDWARGRCELDPAPLRTEGADAQTLLLSCENVVHLDEAGHVKLRDALPADRQVRVVYYLRRLVDVWVSHWQELVKHGLAMSIHEYLAQQATLRMPRNNRIDQVAQLQLLGKTFGEGTVEIVGYDAARNAQGGIVGDFLGSVLGIDRHVLPTATRTVNAREPHARMELVRLLNRIHLDTERHAATHTLRMAVFDALDAGKVPFEDRFSALVRDRTRPVVIQMMDTVVGRQQRVARLFGDRILGGKEAVDAYLKLGPREVECFEFPLVGEDALLNEIVDFYHSLPKAARRSVGSRA